MSLEQRKPTIWPLSNRTRQPDARLILSARIFKKGLPGGWACHKTFARVEGGFGKRRSRHPKPQRRPE